MTGGRVNKCFWGFWEVFSHSFQPIATAESDMENSGYFRLALMTFINFIRGRPLFCFGFLLLWSPDLYQQTLKEKGVILRPC